MAGNSIENSSIDESVFIAEGARVIGGVSIGKHSSVWYNAVIRADVNKITIGEETNIQDCCVLHVDEAYPIIIGNGVVVGHGAVLHGCTVCDHTLIGMGATVLNGAKIGTGCLIGSGALVTGNMAVPDGKLVLGCPGKVVRDVTEEEKEDIIRSAAEYAAFAKENVGGI